METPEASEFEDGVAMSRAAPTGATGVRAALAMLIALNCLNYVDRNLLAGAQPVLQGFLRASDSRLGGLSSYFFVAYMFAAPLLGWLGDRLPRRILVPASVFWWSAALGLSTMGGSFAWFAPAYVSVAIGEAAFGVYAVALLSDYYPQANRARILSLYIVAMTAGRALGYPLGGWLAQSFGWKAPFRLMATVGVLLGLLALKLLVKPAAGDVREAHEQAASGPSTTPARALFGRGFVLAVLGLAMENFASGGIAVWLPTYLNRSAGYSAAHAASLLGGITLVGGLGATWAGGVAGDRLLRRDRRALYWISAACLLLAIPFVVAMLNSSGVLILVGVAGTQILLALNLGPLNNAILNAVPASIRSTAIAVALFLIHALGDAISPKLIGGISDAHGLRMGLSITVVALVIGGVALLAGASAAPRRQDPVGTPS